MIEGWLKSGWKMIERWLNMNNPRKMVEVWSKKDGCKWLKDAEIIIMIKLMKKRPTTLAEKKFLISHISTLTQNIPKIKYRI